MSYCINPACPQPKNPANAVQCQACGSKLLLRERYRMVRALGRGGFGATFLARDESLPGKPPCVIKQLRPSTDSPHVLQMARDLFQREAKTLGKIGNHPQVPRLLDYFEIQQEFFLVQEFVNGLTLQQEVKRGGPFSEAGIKQFLSEIMPMIQYIHGAEVIHRDIKPANMIRREQDKKLVLIDFGAVKDKVNPVKATSTEQTALTAYAIGTPGYAPPEQMAMRPVYASDLYAVGVTCIYLLTGKSPKDLDYDPNTGEMLWRNRVHISDHLANVLQKMLEISVRHRYQSAEAILRDLDLEPYLDSLAQNMAFPSSGGPNSGPLSGGTTQITIGPSDPSEGVPSSPAARMAAAIRARRERSNTRQAPPTASGRRTGNTGHTGLNGATRGSVGPPKKLTSDEVKIAYAKGRRDFSMQLFAVLNLPKVDLTGANFTQAQLPKANFQGAILSSTNFGRTNLAHAVFRNAKLDRAYFTYANLENTDLRGATLTNAYLNNANLRGTNLCGADLTGALVGDEQLAMARTNWSTIYPNGRRGFR